MYPLKTKSPLLPLAVTADILQKVSFTPEEFDSEKLGPYPTLVVFPLAVIKLPASGLPVLGILTGTVTSNFELGPLFPMPTSPAEVMRRRSAGVNVLPAVSEELVKNLRFASPSSLMCC